MIADIDDTLENADWIRSMRWLPDVTTTKELLQFLQVVDEDQKIQRKAIDDFMRLPASRQMPDRIRIGLQASGLL